MATGEQQPELVGSRFSDRGRIVEQPNRGRLSISSRHFPSNAVERLAPGDRGHPCRGVVWHAGTLPLRERDDGSVLDGVLGEIEVASQSNEGGQDSATFDSHHLFKKSVGFSHPVKSP